MSSRRCAIQLVRSSFILRMRSGTTTPKLELEAVLDVAQRSRGGQRRFIVVESPAVGLDRAEAGKGQMQDGGPHLFAETLTLERHGRATIRS